MQCPHDIILNTRMADPSRVPRETHALSRGTPQQVRGHDLVGPYSMDAFPMRAAPGDFIDALFGPQRLSQM